MKDIGYYAGFLTADQQQEITKYELHQACRLMALTTQEVLENNDKPKSKKGVSTFLYAAITKLSDRDKIALIRGLCDRIEVKLMEEAKND